MLHVALSVSHTCIFGYGFWGREHKQGGKGWGWGRIKKEDNYLCAIVDRVMRFHGISKKKMEQPNLDVRLMLGLIFLACHRMFDMFFADQLVLEAKGAIADHPRSAVERVGRHCRSRDDGRG